MLEGLQNEHEEISARYILSEPLSSIISRDLNSDPALVAALVDEALPIPETYREEGLLYRSLLSGTLDPDKLDYLNRDAYYCGVPYGIQDLEYLFSQVFLGRLSDDALLESQPTSPFRIGIPERGLTIIESLIFSRYLMYRTVYWHRNVRALSAPVIEGTAQAIELDLISEEQILRSDDQSFPALFEQLQLPERQLCLQAQQPRSFLVVDELCLGNAEADIIAQLRNRSQRQKLCLAVYQSLQKRYSKQLRDLKPWQVMLDLTGPRKMQIKDIYVSQPLRVQARHSEVSGPIPFTQSSTVLQPSTLEDFRKSLTMLRLILPLEYSHAISTRYTRLSLPYSPLSDFLAGLS